MKNILFVAGLVSAICSTSEAMDIVYTLENVPFEKFHLIQHDSHFYVYGSRVEHLRFEGSEFNGLPTHAPLYILGQDTPAAIIQKLTTTFDKLVNISKC